MVDVSTDLRNALKWIKKHMKLKKVTVTVLSESGDNADAVEFINEFASSYDTFIQKLNGNTPEAMFLKTHIIEQLNEVDIDWSELPANEASFR